MVMLPVRSASSAKAPTIAALELLRRFVHGRDSAEGALLPQELEPLERLGQETGYIKADVPRVILVGQFKAGKSTLLNALLGGNHAAADFLEMTSWVARYWPAERPFCRVTLADGTQQELSPNEFREKCERREFTAAELARIDRVDVGVSTIARFSVIDCPGLGSITRENERRLIDALEEGDLLIWVVDVDCIGEAREGALIRTLLSQSVPRIVALSKCDLLDGSDEIDEIRGYLQREYRIEPEAVFPTSAHAALEAAQSGRVVGRDTGIPALLEYLNCDVSSRHLELRCQAENAHFQRMGELASTLLGRVETDLVRVVQSLDRFREIAQDVREAVQAQIEYESEAWVRDRMFLDKRLCLAGELEGALRAGRGALSAEAITAIFEAHLGSAYLDSFWREIVLTMSRSATSLWAERLRTATEELQESCEALRSSAWEDLAHSISPEGVQARVDALANATFATAMSASLGVAGVATVYAAAAAQVTLGMAATGIGIPIAVMGAGVSAVLWKLEKSKAERTLRSRATEILDQHVEQFIADILRPHFFPRFADVNRQIESALVGNLADKIAARLPHEDLPSLLQEVRRARQALPQLGLIGS